MRFTACNVPRATSNTALGRFNELPRRFGCMPSAARIVAAKPPSQRARRPLHENHFQDRIIFLDANDDSHGERREGAMCGAAEIRARAWALAQVRARAPTRSLTA